MKQWQKYAAELLGTFAFLLIGYMSILAVARGSAGDEVVIALGFGLGLMAALYAFGEVSGGHFNPIVSLGMFFDRRLSVADLVRYWLAQFAGAILAALLVLLAFTDSDAVGQTATVSSDNWRGFVLEIVGSAIFVAVILNSTKAERHRGTALVAIPLTLAAIHLALIPFSGSSVNPARSIGSTLIGSEGWGDIWIYLIAPPIGALLGWIAYAVAVTGETKFRDDFDRMRSDVSGGPAT